MKMLNGLHRRIIALAGGQNCAAPPDRESVKAGLTGRRVFARLRSEEGQALVEAAMMIGIAMFAMVCIASFSIVIYNRTLLEQAVYIGANDLKVMQNASGGVIPCDQATTDMHAVGLNPSKMGITFYEAGTAVSGSTCSATLQSGTIVSVTATYPANLGPFYSGVTLSVSATLTSN